METLKSGDVPALVTNIEVMQILSARADARKKDAEDDKAAVAAGKRRKRRTDDKRHRHRDFIESKLLEYLKHSSCGEVDASKMPEFVGKLRGNDADRAAASNNDSQLDNGADVKMEDKAESNPDDNRGEQHEEGGGGKDYSLTDGETLQILNHLPSELVELHLIVEDLPNRMTDERQEELLAMVGKYSGRKHEDEDGETELEEDLEQKKGSAPNNDNGEDGDEGDEEILGTISDEEQ